MPETWRGAKHQRSPTVEISLLIWSATAGQFVPADMTPMINAGMVFFLTDTHGGINYPKGGGSNRPEN